MSSGARAMDEDTVLLTRMQLSGLLQVCSKSIRRLELEGMPHVCLGSGPRARKRYVRDEVVEWLRGRGRRK